MTEERRQYLTVQQAQHIDVMTLGDVLAKSGYFVDAKIAAQAIVKVLAGQEMGIGPIASMTGINIIQGKPAVGANIMAALVKASPKYDFRVRQLDDNGASIEFFERHGDKWESIGISSFTRDDAIKAGTKNIDKFPRNMFFARAMSNGMKWFCPDVVTMPMYSPDELGADIDWETGDIINAPATTVNTVTGEIARLELARNDHPVTGGQKPTTPVEQLKPVPPKMSRPLTPKQLRESVAIKTGDKPTTSASEAQQTRVVSVMSAICNGDDNMRHVLLRELCDVASTKNLSGAQASALIDWSGATAANNWTPVPDALQEARAVYDAFQTAAGQTAMPLDVPAVKPEPEY